MVEYEKTVARLKAGEELNEDDLKTLMWVGQVVDVIEGEEHRWTRDMTTIIEIDGELYAIEWDRGLTEYQENLYCSQPYRVVRKEKQITVTCYEREENE